MAPGTPLFLTRFSLSQRTAIGVQTRLLLEDFPAWNHVFWASTELARHPGSRGLEHPVLSRWSLFKRPGPAAEAAHRLGLGWWDGNRLREARRRQFSERYRGRTSAIYAAPLDERDSARMRHLIGLVGRPFVLHLWDMHDGDLAATPETLWLVRHAARVLCLSEAMIEEVKRYRSDPEIFRFTRRPAAELATAPVAGPLRIALVGNLSTYQEGLALLDEAAAALAARGPGIEIHYIGPERLLRQIRLPIVARIRAAGFQKSDAGRDRVLACCHVAFLSGPSQPPEADPWARYSIPSRLLDFLALGLPIVGCVHPRTATAHLCRDLGVDEFLYAQNGGEVANSLAALRDPGRWIAASTANREAFSSLLPEARSAQLAEILRQAAQD